MRTAQQSRSTKEVKRGNNSVVSATTIWWEGAGGGCYAAVDKQIPVPGSRVLFVCVFNLKLVPLALRAENRQKLERLRGDVW